VFNRLTNFSSINGRNDSKIDRKHIESCMRVYLLDSEEVLQSPADIDIKDHLPSNLLSNIYLSFQDS
jgi:hypothetical protein